MSPRSIQLWSYNYAPEPTGIGPVSATWAREMVRRGHRVEVVAAHPHYPSPDWGIRIKPYRERRDGLGVLRLPLWIGRDTAAQRLRQEASFTAALALAAPLLARPDVIVAVSPSFPALSVTMASARLRRVPWILWLQDIVTAGAQTTGLLDSDAPALRAARSLERAAYRSASRIAVISDAFRARLLEDDVAAQKVVRVYNPATQPLRPAAGSPANPPKIVTMGNIGQSQGLEDAVRAFEDSAALAGLDAHLTIAGHGVAAPAVRSAVRTRRVAMPGLLTAEQLERELESAWVGLVSQRGDISEFNLPSKLMNFMGRGLPVVAWVHPDSETAALVRASGAGWIAPAGDAPALQATLVDALSDVEERARRGATGHAFALAHFTPEACADAFERMCADVLDRGSRGR